MKVLSTTLEIDCGSDGLPHTHLYPQQYTLTGASVAMWLSTFTDAVFKFVNIKIRQNKLRG